VARETLQRPNPTGCLTHEPNKRLRRQVITLLHSAFTRAGLGLYLRPYGCMPTGYECGIIECVPNTRSRAALGELSDRWGAAGDEL
jgi:hypothetical protein